MYWYNIVMFRGVRGWGPHTTRGKATRMDDRMRARPSQPRDRSLHSSKNVQPDLTSTSQYAVAQLVAVRVAVHAVG